MLATLNAYLGLTKGPVSQALNSLRPRGLVVKQVDPGDRRRSACRAVRPAAHCSGVVRSPRRWPRPGACPHRNERRSREGSNRYRPPALMRGSSNRSDSAVIVGTSLAGPPAVRSTTAGCSTNRSRGRNEPDLPRTVAGGLTMTSHRRLGAPIAFVASSAVGGRPKSRLHRHPTPASAVLLLFYHWPLSPTPSDYVSGALARPFRDPTGECHGCLTKEPTGGRRTTTIHKRV